MKQEYTVIFEEGENNWSAYSPDVPGCVAAAATRRELEILFKEALEFHLEGLKLDGETLPEPGKYVGKVEVEV